MNRDTINKMSLIDLLDKISKGIDECLYKVLSNCSDVQKKSRCEKLHNCYSCLSEWLNEGGKLMFIDGKWYTELEIKAHIMELQKKLLEDTYSQELEAQIEQMRKFLDCVRAYFGDSIGWIDLFEDGYQKLSKGRTVIQHDA